MTPPLACLAFSELGGLSVALAMACRKVRRLVDAVRGVAETSFRRRSSIWVVCFSVRLEAVVRREVVWCWIRLGRGWVGSLREMRRLSVSGGQYIPAKGHRVGKCKGKEGRNGIEDGGSFS
jgi:hypothetical protein